MSERASEREKKRAWVLTTSLIFMLMHFAALCFHFPPLCPPRSGARHTRLSQGEGRAARENEERDKWGGKKEEKTTGQTSRQANTKALFFFFLCAIKGVTYLLARGEDEESNNGKAGRTRRKREKAQRGTESTHQRQAERGINERGGERRQGKVTLDTHEQRESERGRLG